MTTKDYHILQWAQEQAKGMLGAYTGGPDEANYKSNLARLQTAMQRVRAATDKTPPLEVDKQKALANELRVTLTEAGGFFFVDLYDADDYDKFQLGEDEIVSLHRYLGKVIAEKELV